MTNERDKKETDALVSETYREIPTPRVPDHLNQTILRMAANKRAGKGDFLFAKWMKPVTLAATIALSLTIVMELTEVPTTAVQTELAPAIEQREDEATSADERFVEELTLKDTDLAKSEARGKMDSFAASPSSAALPAARKRAADMPDSNQPAAMSLDSDQVVAEGLIAEAPVASKEITSAKTESAAAACDEKSRQSADTWLDCIDDLRESGLTRDADREYEAFILEYPAEAANSESNK